jgi:hypothetical protein
MPLSFFANSRLVRSLASLGAAAGLALAAVSAAAQVPVKLVLNWKYEGPQAWFFVAQDKASRPRASTSRSTRARAPRPRSPRWRRAHTRPASAISTR